MTKQARGIRNTTLVTLITTKPIIGKGNCRMTQVLNLASVDLKVLPMVFVH